MSIKILVKRGLEADLASAGVAAGELKFTTDTKKLYIGTGSENVQIGGDGAGSWGSIVGDIEDQADLQVALGGKVPTTRTINNKALTADVVLKMSDLQNDANYAKIANVDAAGHKLNVSMDTTDYVLTLKLLDKNKNVINLDPFATGSVDLKNSSTVGVDLKTMVQNKYIWIDKTSLEVKAVSPSGYNYKHYYYDPYWTTDKTNLTEFTGDINTADGRLYVAMKLKARDAGLPDFQSPVSITFIFKVYNIWFHEREITFTVDVNAPNNQTARQAR